MTFCKYGTHRVIEPVGVLPQAAQRLEAPQMCYDNELLIEVNTLNIDSASFHQIKEACQYDVDAMKTMIMEIVSTRGKMQNPVTKSGGMLIGRVKEVGSSFHNQTLQVGQPIATLVSLSLTPLTIDRIKSINMENEQVHMEGHAIVFDSGIYAEIPEDLDEHLVLAALDVAGAPAQVRKLSHEGDTVLVIGAAGKSGLLCALEAKQRVGKQGHVIGVVNEAWQVEVLKALEVCDTILLEDATQPLAVYQQVHACTKGALADVTINVVNVENTEMTAVLATKDEGIVYFFSMATSFTKAALGAEGVGKDVQMIIGNGYTKHHAQITLDLLRENPKLKAYFESKYAQGGTR